MMATKEDEAKPKPLKKEAAAANVADLERRLADLSSLSAPAPAPAAPSISVGPPSIMAKPAPAAPAATATPGKNNALLARIMAAQERAKQAKQAPNPTPAPAFTPPPSATFTAPPPATTFSAPPPPAASVAASMDPFAAPAPNAFSAPPPAPNAFTAPPPAPDVFGAPPPPATDVFGAPPPPAAPPAFGGATPDLLSMDAAPPAFDQSALPPAAMPPPPTFDPMMAPPAASAPSFEDLDVVSPLKPPPVPPPQEQSGLDEEAIQAIMGMEGMSEAEKRAMIDEQMKIMKSIEEKNKPVSAADAFESRSFSAAVGAVRARGQDKTREAVQNGTAVKVQCSQCDQWMQVTNAAELMFCPNCQTVTPVIRESEGDQQVDADAKLAEMLQKEEYETAERQTAQRKAKSAAAAAKKSSSGGWMEWMGFGTPAPAPAAEEEVRFSGNAVTGTGGGGTTATQQPLFACVTDSINNAASYAMHGIAEDDEGNVHGVDSSGLLAVTQVGRNKEDNR